MRRSRRSRISFRFSNEFFATFGGVVFGFILGARAWFRGFSLTGMAYCLILLISAVISLLKKKRGFCLALIVGAVLGILPSAFLQSASVSVHRGIVVEVKANYFLFHSGGITYYVAEKNTVHEVGDLLNIQGNSSPLRFTEYEGRFSFADYLNTKGVHYELKASDILSIFNRPFRLRSAELEFLSAFDDNTATWIDAIVFNHRDSSDPIFDSISAMGLYATLSNGGIFLSLYIRALDHVGKKVFRKEGTTTFLHFLALGPFLLFAPTKIGVWRVFLREVHAVVFKRQSLNKIQLLTLNAGTLLIFYPWAALQSGFFYGYGLSLVFTLSGPLIGSISDKTKRFFASRLLMEAFLLPIAISRGSLSLLAPLFRLLFFPFIAPFLFLSEVSFFTLPFPRLFGGYAKGIRAVLSFLSNANLSLPIFGYNGEALIILYYVLLVAALFLLDGGFGRYAKHAAVTFAVIVALNASPLYNLVSGQVTFLNVGQGDAIIIRDRLKTVMIDTGGVNSFDMAAEVDIPYLRRQRIYHIDYLIASHGDFDHIGAASSLMSHFDVSHFIDSTESFPLTIGRLHFVNYNIYGGDDENAKSLVLGLEFLGKRWLFMGDAPISVERRIIVDHPELRCDIFKVGHHGSDTSTCLEFLRAVQPKEAVISCGANNRYGHPTETVLERLNRENVRIRRTDLEGSIVYRGFG